MVAGRRQTHPGKTEELYRVYLHTDRVTVKVRMRAIYKGGLRLYSRRLELNLGTGLQLDLGPTLGSDSHGQARSLSLAGGWRVAQFLGHQVSTKGMSREAGWAFPLSMESGNDGGEADEIWRTVVTAHPRPEVHQ